MYLREGAPAVGPVQDDNVAMVSFHTDSLGRYEEQALLVGLGEPYRRFCITRAHLFPGVW